MPNSAQHGPKRMYSLPSSSSSSHSETANEARGHSRAMGRGDTPVIGPFSPECGGVHGGVWGDSEWTTTRLDANDHIADSVNSPNPASQVKLLQAIRCRAQETIVVGSAYHAHRPHQLRHIAAAPPGIRRNMHLRGSRVRFPCYGRRPCWP